MLQFHCQSHLYRNNRRKICKICNARLAVNLASTVCNNLALTLATELVNIKNAVGQGANQIVWGDWLPVVEVLQHVKYKTLQPTFYYFSENMINADKCSASAVP